MCTVVNEESNNSLLALLYFNKETVAIADFEDYFDCTPPL